MDNKKIRKCIREPLWSINLQSAVPRMRINFVTPPRVGTCR
jgi:hypothetical protein